MLADVSGILTIIVSAITPENTMIFTQEEELTVHLEDKESSLT
jgi:hypothetical protein